MIHHTSEILSKNIGMGTKIWQYCAILEGAIIGENCNINFGVFIENDVIIGNNVTIKSGVQLWDGVRIADNVFVGPNVSFTNDLLPRSKRTPNLFLKTYIDEGASLGANSTILAGCRIGKYAMIGAGSVVTKEVLPYTVIIGVPGRQSGFITKEGILISMDMFDKNGNHYEIVGGEPVLSSEPRC